MSACNTERMKNDFTTIKPKKGLFMKERFSKMLLTSVLSVLLGTSMSNLSAQDSWERSWDQGYQDIGYCEPVCCEDHNFAFAADYLYWQTVQEDFDLAIVDTNPALNVLGNASTEYFKYKYKSGFRLAAAYRFPCRDWGIGVVWTYYHPKQSKHVNPVEGGKLVSTQVPNFFNGTPRSYLDSNTQNKLRFDQVDILAATSYNYGDTFKLRPYFGARLVFLKQNVYTTLDRGPGIGDDTARWRYNLPAGGVTLGVQGKYTVCGGISLIGHWGTSIVGGRVNHHSDWVDGETGLSYTERRHHGQILGGWDASLGLGYDWCFCGTPLSLSIGYEIQDWWNSPQRPRFVNGGNGSTISGSLAQVTGDSASRLTFHGLFVRAGFVF